MLKKREHLLSFHLWYRTTIPYVARCETLDKKNMKSFSLISYVIFHSMTFSIVSPPSFKNNNNNDDSNNNKNKWTVFYFLLFSLVFRTIATVSHTITRTLQLQMNAARREEKINTHRNTETLKAKYERKYT